MMRRVLLAGLVIVGLASGIVWFTSHQASPAGRITEFPVPTANSAPQDITAGPDGNLWFTEIMYSTIGNNLEVISGKIGRISPGGTITEFPVPTANSAPQNITVGPDGNLWFTESGSNKIGRITPSGTITEFPVLTASGGPFGITAGPDGNLWFTEVQNNKFELIGDKFELIGNKIGRISPNGTITEFPVPTANSLPLGITAGPDGNLWFTEAIYTEPLINPMAISGKIGRISPGGTITEFPVPTASRGPFGITAGPDGNLWFTESGSNKIGRISPGSTITEFPVPSANSGLESITAGPDGNLWFTETIYTGTGNNLKVIGGKIGRITSGK